MEKLYQDLKSNSSSNKKQEILKSVADNNIKEALRLCYEPMIQFYIKKFEPNFDPTAKGTFKTTSAEFFDLLKKLNARIYTGNAAKFAVESFLSKCTPETQHIYSLIIKKDLKVGITETALNKAYGKDFIEEFKVQLANTFLPTKKYKGVEYWWASPKLDGIRSYSVYDSIKSRSGHDQKGFEHIIEEVNRLLEMGFEFVDGELFTNEVDFEDIQGFVGATKNIDKEKKNKIYYNVFAVGRSDYKNTEDMINAMNSINWSQFKYLRQVKYIKVENTSEAVIKLCKQFVREGYEGVMLRHPEKWYEWKRSDALLKFKLFKEDDFKCIGFNAGDKGTKYEHTLGTILVEGFDKILDDDGNLIENKPICSEVSGFTDKMRDEIWNNKDFYLGKLVEVKYQNSTKRIDSETGKYSLRFASFLKWKLDRQ